MRKRLGGAASIDCHDSLSLQTMMYMQISCWSLAQSSRLMTPEYGKIDEMDFNLTPAKQGSCTMCIQ